MSTTNSAAQSAANNQESTAKLNLPADAIETLKDIREDSGCLGESICKTINEMILFIIRDSIDDEFSDWHSEKLQSLSFAHRVIETLSK